MNAAEKKVKKALTRDGGINRVSFAADAVLTKWIHMGSPVEWEEAIVRLADALIAESKNDA